MSQLRDYIEKYPWEAQRLVGSDYEQLMLVNQPSSKITQSENTGSRAEKKKNYQNGRRSQEQVKWGRASATHLNVSASVTYVPNVRDSKRGQRINCQLYLSWMVRNFNRLAARLPIRTGEKKRIRVGRGKRNIKGVWINSRGQRTAPIETNRVCITKEILRVGSRRDIPLKTNW